MQVVIAFYIQLFVQNDLQNCILALFKCPDMDVVKQGSTKCNSDERDDSWYFKRIWDQGQNCLPGCISRMNENNWEEACCEAVQRDDELKGTDCHVYHAVDVVKTGDNDIKDTKAVKCKGTLEHF